jgi:CRISPR-associated protein Csb1
VKFDRLGKTTSGQPIFAVDEEVAQEIRATFIIDLALLRSYGRSSKGLTDDEKLLLLELALWKVKRLLQTPFRYRSGCYLQCVSTDVSSDDTRYAGMPALQLKDRIHYALLSLSL